MSSPSPLASVIRAWGPLPDPRLDRCKKHNLLDILVIAVLAQLCGCDSFAEIERWAMFNEERLRALLPLPHGIPSHDTFSRVFRLLDPAALERVLQDLLEPLRASLKPTSHIAMDGKSLRGSFDTATAQSPLHLVNAYATEAGLTLGTVKVAGKSNEITAIPELLFLIDIKKCSVTIDAAGCQTAIAEAILEKGGDYILGLKDNQPTMASDVELRFAVAERAGFAGCALHSEQGTGHGRTEKRTTVAMKTGPWLQQRVKWAGLCCVVMVLSERTQKGKTTVTRRYYLSSLKPNAEKLARLIRSHWQIENNLHWQLDAAGFAEDKSRVRKDNGPINLALLRRLTAGLLTHFHPQPHIKPPPSIKSKRKMCGWNFDYALEALTGQKIMR